jgi:4-hydroxy-tetrahydrodipicolinate reductase
MVRIALVGFGAIGSAIAAHCLEKKHDLLVVVDSSPAKAGKTLRELSGLNSDVRVMQSLNEVPLDDIQVTIFATSSKLGDIVGDLEYVLRKGIRVVSTCEELAFPAWANSEDAVRLDGIAKQNGTTVVGVGVNPGFVMDWVPAVVASASKNPTEIRVKRSVNVGRRRKQLQAKMGVGLTRARFEKGLQDGTIGHVGLVESLQLVAASLGREATDVTWTIHPVLGAEDYVTGATQTAEGIAGACKIRLELEMTISSSDFDLIEVNGDPHIKVRFENGVFGDSATVALTVNAAERVMRARAGLVTILELPLVSR